MCVVCEELETKIERAKQAGDKEGARIMNVILEGHWANTCPDTRIPATVRWPNGTLWVVRE